MRYLTRWKPVKTEAHAPELARESGKCSVVGIEQARVKLSANTATAVRSDANDVLARALAAP